MTSTGVSSLSKKKKIVEEKLKLSSTLECNKKYFTDDVKNFIDKKWLLT